MIISHKYKFIFIKNLKTAGTSLESYLSGVCGEGDIFTPIFPEEAGHQARNWHGLFMPFRDLENRKLDVGPSFLGVIRDLVTARKFHNHMPAVSVRARVPEDLWNSYTKFCVERNPLEKVASYYRMLASRGHVASVDEMFSKGMFPSDWTRYTDQDGNVIVDDVLKYESLNLELTRLFQRLGVPFCGELEVRAKSNLSNQDGAIQGSDCKVRASSDPQFNRAQMKKIRDVFSREIDRFYNGW